MDTCAPCINERCSFSSTESAFNSMSWLSLRILYTACMYAVQIAKIVRAATKMQEHFHCARAREKYFAMHSLST